MNVHFTLVAGSVKRAEIVSSLAAWMEVFVTSFRGNVNVHQVSTKRLIVQLVATVPNSVALMLATVRSLAFAIALNTSTALSASGKKMIC